MKGLRPADRAVAVGGKELARLGVDAGAGRAAEELVAQS
jgi:hypothetical protein